MLQELKLLDVTSYESGSVFLRVASWYRCGTEARKAVPHLYMNWPKADKPVRNTGSRGEHNCLMPGMSSKNGNQAASLVVNKGSMEVRMCCTAGWPLWSVHYVAED